MNNYIVCGIEFLRFAGEDACVISVDWNNLDHAIVLLGAFRLDIINKITWINKDRINSVDMEKNRRNNQKSCCIHIEHNTYGASSDWIDAVLSMLIRSRLNGWSNTDHLDCELTNSDKLITLCISVDCI